MIRAGAMDERLDSNKMDAQAFHDLMFNESRPADAIERYVGDEYIQHNAGVADGRQAFVEYFTRNGEGISRKES